MARVSEFTERALGFARAAGEPTTEAFAHFWVATLELARGRADVAFARIQEAHARALAAGAGFALGYTVTGLGMAQAALGDIAGARATLEPPVSTGMDQGFALALALTELAAILRIAAEPAAAEARAGEALAIAERIGIPHLIADSKEIVGRVAAGRADWALAEALAHEALTIRVERGLRLQVPQTFDALAEIAAGVGSHTEAARILGIAAASRAELSLQRSAPDVPHVAQLERESREALGDEAYEHAYREGRELAPEEAVTWIRRARGERKRPARGWESMTATELRVAALVAQGLTNPEIGERMFISRGTVKVHLSHIFAKLGIGTRSELAAEATRRDRAS